MIQPKLFYRQLDEILQGIGGSPTGRQWLGQILQEIVHSFGVELHVDSGRLYVETEDGFFLERETQSKDPLVKGIVIARTYPPIELVLSHGVYLFDASIESQERALEERLGGLESAALLVDSDPRRILAFGLSPGWDRVHLDFALGTIRNSINQRLRMEALRNDLAQAAEIQRSLLPRTIPDLEGFSIAARSEVASEVGGDFYDVIAEGPDSLYLALGDASGHGLGSALLARDVVTGIRMGADKDLKITSLIERLNRVIARSMLSTRFVSLFLGELETNGSLFYVNAGHIPPWIFGAQGTRRLTVGGMILGPVSESRFKRGFAHLDRGDTMLVVSDGLIERRAEDGSEFGEARIESVVGGLIGQDPKEVVAALFAECERHGGHTPWKDDATALVITRSIQE